MEEKRILFIGAHPDDCEVTGGMAAMQRKLGRVVKFMSLTNGDAGHHLMEPAELAKRRLGEAQKVADRFGIEYEVWNVHDGYLTATSENRDRLIRSIRSFRPDLIIANRPNDYHPDHRNAAQLLQDSSYIFRVPLICRDVKAMEKDPVILYRYDIFTYPAPFEADIIIDIDSVKKDKGLMWYIHESQSFEWLPFIGSYEDELPRDRSDYKKWIIEFAAKKYSSLAAEKYRDKLIEKYPNGAEIKTAEAYQICEYGAKPSEELLKELIPF